ncbi:hypothetical protein V502_07916 [Pseudogymnoascus sp. VKM F-4520 (FW-2644)]|nr:hypothetical protein V502_07916 [Pseudogymnoascus sp. VKM F-4520 (FW-2644)]
MAPIVPPEQPWDEKTERKFEGKAYSEYFDPCQDLATRSLKCLHRNGGQREMCSDYFQAYRDCKKQWLADRKEAKRKNAKPWFGSNDKPEEPSK